jgi:hypothetical protein
MTNKQYESVKVSRESFSSVFFHNQAIQDKNQRNNAPIRLINLSLESNYTNKNKKKTTHRTKLIRKGNFANLFSTMKLDKLLIE